MRKLIALPLAGFLVIAVAGPMAAADPCVLGADAQDCAPQVQAEGSTGTDVDVSGATVTDQGSTGSSATNVVTDELVELHKAKGAPTDSPDRL